MSLATDVKPNEVVKFTITGDVAEIIGQAIRILGFMDEKDAYVLWHSFISPDAPTGFYVFPPYWYWDFGVVDEKGDELLVVNVDVTRTAATVRTRLPLKKAEELLRRIINTVYNYVLISGHLGGGREKIADLYLAHKLRDLVETVAPELSALNPEVYNALKSIPRYLKLTVVPEGVANYLNYSDEARAILARTGVFKFGVSFTHSEDLVVDAIFDPVNYILNASIRLGSRPNLGTILLTVHLVHPIVLIVEVKPGYISKEIRYGKQETETVNVLSMAPPSVFYYVLNNWCSIALEALERISGTVKDSRLMRNVNLLKVAVEEACKQLQSNTG